METVDTRCPKSRWFPDESATKRLKCPEKSFIDGLGTGCRRFEPGHPDHEKSIDFCRCFFQRNKSLTGFVKYPADVKYAYEILRNGYYIVEEVSAVIKIMFVCHGNICRSPMAEMVFKSIMRENGAETEFSVDSSATSYEEIGNPIYPPAKKVLREHGISFSEHYSKKLYPEDYSRYDMFIVMDENNMRNIRRIFTSDSENKLKKLMDFTPFGGDVADPYYSGDFEKTFEDILTGCEALFDYLK